MAKKPTYEELEKRIKELEKEVVDRKRSEEMLRESEGKWRTVFESSHDYIFSKDREGRYIALNHNAAVGLGGTCIDDIIGKTDYDLMPKKLAKALQETDKQIMETGKDMETEECVGTDENMIYTLSHKWPIYDNKGRAIGITGYAMDITERKQAQKALQESEERFRCLSESSPLGVFQTDKDGAVLYLNNKWLDITGMPMKDALGFGWAKALHPEDQPRILTEWAKCLEEKRGYDGEFRFVKQSGEVCWVHTCTSPVFSSTGDVISHVGTNEDISERKQAEEALRESEEKYRILVNTAPYGIQLTDLDGKIVFSNPAHHRIQGYAESELIGKFIWDLVADEQFKSQTREYYEMLIKEQPPPETVYSKDRTKDGRLIDTQINWDYILNSEGETEGIVSIISDITEPSKVKEALRESKKYMSKAQEIAHLGHWKLNPETGEIFGSDELFRIFDLSREGATLEAFAGVVHPDDREYDLYHIRRGMEQGEPWDIEHRLLLKDGNEKTVHAIGEAIKGETGKIVELVGTVQDITERKETEQKLKESEQKIMLSHATDYVRSYSMESQF